MIDLSPSCRRFGRLAAAPLFVLLLALAAPGAAQVPSAVFVFGDSLSDIGNVYAASGGELPPDPPYYQGRFSNGPVWIEVAQERLGIESSRDRNFAEGGARTDGHPSPSLRGMIEQVDLYLSIYVEADPDALYVLWAGGNDYLNGTIDHVQVVENIETCVSLLIDAGATRILVCNLPDLGQTPGGVASGDAETLSVVTSNHNTRLATAMATLAGKSPGVSIEVFDVYGLFNDILAAPGEFGFTNTSTPCFNGVSVCPDPDASLFWDDIHPTAAAHRLLGQLAAAAILGPVEQSALIVR